MTVTSRSRRRPRLWWRRRPGTAAAGQAGAVSVELVLLLPVLLLVVLVGMQAALYAHARSLSMAAAREGARAAAAEGATAADGRRAAGQFVDDVAGDSLTAVQVTAARTPTAATVVVTGTTLSVLPGWAPRVRQSASAPAERLTGT